MTYYQSCSTIPIYNFTLLLATKKLTYLIEDFEKKTNAELEILGFKHKRKLKLAFENIFSEYEKVIFDKAELKKTKLEAEIIYLAGKVDIAQKIFNLYEEYGYVEHLSLLNDIGIKFSSDIDISPQITRIKSNISGLKNKLNIKTIRFEKKYNVELDNNNNDDEPITILTKLDKKALILSKNLELGYSINVKKCSVITWNNYEKLDKEQFEIRQKNGKSPY